MYANRDFSPFDSTEMDDFGFDFAKRMTAEGEVITSAEWYCTVAEDSAVADSDAQSHIGSAAYDGTRTICRINGLISGARYVLQAVVTTSTGKTLSLWAHVDSQDPE